MSFVDWVAGFFLLAALYRALDKLHVSRQLKKGAVEVRTPKGWQGWVLEEVGIFRAVRTHEGWTFNVEQYVYNVHQCLRWTGHGWEQRLGVKDESNDIFKLLGPDDAHFVELAMSERNIIHLDRNYGRLLTDWQPASLFYFRTTKGLESVLSVLPFYFR